jgi:hypothetical protein
VVFALYNKWGWLRWCLLGITGAAALFISLYLMWLPQYSKFYTLDLLSHQKIDLEKLKLLPQEMWSGGRGLLLLLTPIAAISFWRSGHAQRRYLACWAAIGAVCALPNFLAFLKVFGAPNNLGIIGFWMALLVWPASVNLIGWLASTRISPNGDSATRKPRTVPIVIYILLLCFLGALLPLKKVPQLDQIAYCQAIDEAVLRDVQSGKKILVTQGAEFYIHAGGTNVPLDQANSALELRAGGQGAALSEMEARIRNHYYDKIYLRFPYWFGGDLTALVNQYYRQDSLITKVTVEAGGQTMPGFMEDCKILSPRQ